MEREGETGRQSYRETEAVRHRGAPHLVPHELDVSWILALDKSRQVMLDHEAGRLAAGRDTAAVAAPHGIGV